MIDNLIKHTFVINLKKAIDRKKHIVEHFEQFGIKNYSFLEATASDSEVVKDYYRNDLVVGYPPCFRIVTCRRNLGSCSNNCNNIIVPQQVANWDSFLRLFKVISQKENGLFLICEDDVHFYDYFEKGLTSFLDMVPLDMDKPAVIRMALSGQPTHQKFSGTISYDKREIMSNAAFIINNKMAQHYLENFTKILNTSDVWFHGWLKNSVKQSFSINPLLATDLSANIRYAKFLSCIHPKGLNEEDNERLKTHVRKVETEAEYKKLVQEWSE